MTIQRCPELTDAEITEIRMRADRFIEEIGCAVSDAIATVDPASPCADASRRSLAKISMTLPDADFILLVNLAQLDEAMKRRIGSSLISIMAVHLRAVGSGPTLDFESADAFLVQFRPLIETARKRKIN